MRIIYLLHFQNHSAAVTAAYLALSCRIQRGSVTSDDGNIEKVEKYFIPNRHRVLDRPKFLILK